MLLHQYALWFAIKRTEMLMLAIERTCTRVVRVLTRVAFITKSSSFYEWG